MCVWVFRLSTFQTPINHKRLKDIYMKYGARMKQSQPFNRD